MADYFASVNVTVGFFDFIGYDGEHFAFEGQFRRDETRLGQVFFLVGGRRCRCLYLGRHRGKLSSCI